MKPRIFVSSTFYDLKYIREDLSNFIKAHDFEPIMFEDGDIGYAPGRPLDDSCYETMKSADMVLLVIGGNYGSPATGEVKDEFKEYMSVTRNEFKEAIYGGIPMYAFVDCKVYAEYEIYDANFDKIEVKKETINFRNTKDINVFRFIREIKGIGHVSITEFEKVIQIKDFLSKQWSDMFKNHLDYLKEKESDKRIVNTVDDMKLLIRQMDIMLNTVGKKILTNGSEEEYNDVKIKQRIITLCEKISNDFKLYVDEEKEDKENRILLINNFIDILYKSFCDGIWLKVSYEDKNSLKEFYLYFNKKDVPLFNVNLNFNIEMEDFKKIVENIREKELLIHELIKNEYYEQIIHKVTSDDYKKLKGIKNVNNFD